MFEPKPRISILKWPYLFGAVGLTAMTWLFAFQMCEILPDQGLAQLLRGIERTTGFKGAVPPLDWFLFWLATIALIHRYRSHRMLRINAGARLAWDELCEDLEHKTLSSENAGHADRMLEQKHFTPFVRCLLSHLVGQLKRSSDRRAMATFLLDKKMQAEQWLTLTWRMVQVMAVLIAAWALCRLNAGFGSDAGGPFAGALLLIGFGLLLRERERVLVQAADSFINLNVLPRFALTDEAAERVVKAFVAEGELVRETIRQELRSGVLENFLTRFRENAEAFENQTERMLKRLHEKMVDVSDNLSRTGDTLKLYVEKGGVADIALLHKTLNDFRSVVNQLGVRFDKAEVLIEELSVLPEAVAKMAGAGQALKLAGEKSQKVTDHIDDMSQKLSEINTTMAREIERNGEINTATEKTLTGLNAEITALKGTIASMNVTLAGIHQAVTAVQQMTHRFPR